MNLPPVSFQKCPACNSPQQCYCKSPEQQGAGHHVLFFLFHSYTLTAPLQTSRTGARGWTQSPYLMPESKAPAGSQSQEWTWVLVESLGMKLAGEVGFGGVSKRQSCLCSVYPLGTRLVHGNTRADGFCGARSWAGGGQAASWRSRGKEAGRRGDCSALVPLTSAPLGAAVCAASLNHPPAEPR